jgi:hypothetical protein
MLTRLQRHRVLAAILALVPTAAAVVAIVTATARSSSSTSSIPPPPSMLPGELTGPPPWPRNTGQLAARLAALGLPALAAEGTTLHYHDHLDLFVDGRRVTVPAGVGISVDGRLFSPLHTHDATGIIHVESPDVRLFTLGEFFGVWGLRLTARCLGGYCAGGGQRVWAYVDGKLVAGDPGGIVLVPHQEIVVAFGTRAQLPRPIPSSYRFPPGL